MRLEYVPFIFPPIVAGMSVVIGFVFGFSASEIMTNTFIFTVLLFGPFWLAGASIYWFWGAARVRENTYRFQAGLMTKEEREAFLAGDYLVGRRTGHPHTLGTLYWRLDCLERDGLVSTRYVEGGEDRGGRRRLLVTLTEKGEALLASQETEDQT